MKKQIERDPKVNPKITDLLTAINWLIDENDPEGKLSAHLRALFSLFSPNQLDYRDLLNPLLQKIISCFQNSNLEQHRALMKGLFIWTDKGTNAEVLLQYLHVYLHLSLPLCPV